MLSTIKPLREQIWNSIISEAESVTDISKRFKVERRLTSGKYYEVMLSPFATMEESKTYIEKYKQYYPPEHQIYRITELSLTK